MTGPCPPWCVDREFEGTADHPVMHAGALFGVTARRSDSSEATVFLQPVRSADVDASQTGVIAVALGDEPPVFDVEPSAARSLAAALLRMAEQLETG